jgi:6,7-dimethyl-8-ribityllumazine synthase
LRHKEQTVTLQGTNKGAGLRFAVVVARFNDFVTDRLESGALAALKAAGVSADDISIIRVPGAFEIPFAARQAAQQGRFAAVICLGCLIRGATAHFEYIAGAASQGIMDASLLTGVPMTFGVLTTNSSEEALERAVPGPANKGWEAAMAAVEMATLGLANAGAGPPSRLALRRPRASGPLERSGEAGRRAPLKKRRRK